MSFSFGPRLAGSLLFAVVAVGSGLIENSAFAQNANPKLRDVSLTSPIGEYAEATLISGVSDPNVGDQLKLRIDWGDGFIEKAFSLTNALRYLTNTHIYRDRAGTNRLTDKYQISLKLLDGKGGIATTNLSITVTNVLRLSVNAESASPSGFERSLEYTEFKLPNPASYPYAITLGPDGNVWFTEGVNRIGRITREGAIREFPVTGASAFAGICTGPDGKLWFTCANSEKIGRITTNGAIRLFDIPHPTGPFRIPWGITRGPDGKSVWFVGWGYRLSRMNTNGVVTFEYLHDEGRNFHGVTVGPDNNLWYTDWSFDAVHRYDPVSGVHTNYDLGYYDTPQAITVGPDNAIWFTEYQNGKIGRITTDGQPTEALVGDYLPQGITAGPDGAMWFTEQRPTNSNIVRLKLNGDIQRFALPWLAHPIEIVSAHGDSVWFTLSDRNAIGRLRYLDTGNAVLHINIYDSPSDRHTVTYDWGDGSAPVTLTPRISQRTFNVVHTYAAPGSYNVHVTAQDDDGTITEATTTIDVQP
jgi:streptogramin lyase